jgi:hypothetical protein
LVVFTFCFVRNFFAALKKNDRGTKPAHPTPCPAFLNPIASPRPPWRPSTSVDAISQQGSSAT